MYGTTCVVRSKAGKVGTVLLRMRVPAFGRSDAGISVTSDVCSMQGCPSTAATWAARHLELGVANCGETEEHETTTTLPLLLPTL
jgi:hypothetical protein